MAMQSETADIYGLLCPFDGKLRYIGKARNAEARLKSHLRDVRHRNTPLYQWIREVLSKGGVPKIMILETCSIDVWKIRERTWIAAAIEDGGFLLNVAPGGDQPFCPAHVRVENGKKVSAARVSTPEKAKIYHAKRVLGQALAMGTLKEETKEKMRQCAARNPRLFACWANI